jgi:hypothetical protein
MLNSDRPAKTALRATPGTRRQTSTPHSASYVHLLHNQSCLGCMCHGRSVLSSRCRNSEGRRAGRRARLAAHLAATAASGKSDCKCN